MKNSIMIHWKKENTRMEWGILLIFLCMVCYGFYKNGFIYLQMGKMNFLESITPLLFPLIGATFSCIIDSIKSKKMKITKKTLILGILLGIMMPPQYPIWLFSISCIVFLLIYPMLKEKVPTISWLVIFKLVSILFTKVLLIPDQNVIEAIALHSYGTLDIFFGRGLGGVGTTNILCICFLFILLTTDFYYKKELPIYVISTFVICFFLYFFFFPNQLTLQQVLNSSLCFSAVLFVPQNETSPATFLYQRVYGVSIGILSFCFIILLHQIEGAYIAIFLGNSVWNIYLLFQKKKFDKIKENI